MSMAVYVWAVLALLLMAAEALVPGAFLLWLGFAAIGVFLAVLAWPGMPVLGQVMLFAVLSFASVLIYRKWFRGRERPSDQPNLNRRALQHIGRRLVLDRPIDGGVGRVRIGDAVWDVSGPDLPQGARVQVVGVDGMTLLVEPEREPSSIA